MTDKSLIEVQMDKMAQRLANANLKDDTVKVVSLLVGTVLDDFKEDLKKLLDEQEKELRDMIRKFTYLKDKEDYTQKLNSLLIIRLKILGDEKKWKK